MRNLLAVTAAVAFACATSFAATTYVVTNNDNPSGNSATIYSLNTSTGVLTQAKVLQTGGTGLGGGFFAAYGTSVSENATCIFVIDNGSNDVAAFQRTSGTNFTKTGNYSNSSLNLSGYAGGSLALSPNGKFLYVSYSGSENIGVWTVGSNCALTLAQTFVPSLGADVFGAIAVNPGGQALLIPAADYEAVNIALINKTTGELTDFGNVQYDTISQCESEGCFPTGVDFTKDSAVALFGNATISGPSVLSANLSTKGISNPQFWDLTNSAGVGNVNVPFLSAAAYSTGSGPLYLGASGYGPDGVPSGEITASFTEKPLNITVTNSTLITNADEYQFTLAATGSTMLTAEYPNSLNSYHINSDGSITLLQSTTDQQANSGGSGLNFVFYPNTR